MQEIKKYLISKQDKDYCNFTMNLKSCSERKHLGVRIPLLKNYAKELLKEHTLEELYHCIDEEYDEEVMLKGYIIGSEKNISFEELKEYLDDFISKIHDWATCDTFVSTLRMTKKYDKEMFALIKKYLKSKKEFTKRFAVIMLNSYYLNKPYFDKIYSLINKITLDQYYVKMGVAWLLSSLLIKDYARAYEYLKNSDIDDWTVNKAISKAIDSFRITKDKKEELKKIRRKG